MIVAYIDDHKDRVVEGPDGSIRLGVEPICDTLRSAGVEVAPSTPRSHRGEWRGFVACSGCPGCAE